MKKVEKPVRNEPPERKPSKTKPVTKSLWRQYETMHGVVRRAWHWLCKDSTVVQPDTWLMLKAEHESEAATVRRHKKLLAHAISRTFVENLSAPGKVRVVGSRIVEARERRVEEMQRRNVQRFRLRAVGD